MMKCLFSILLLLLSPLHAMRFDYTPEQINHKLYILVKEIESKKSLKRLQSYYYIHRNTFDTNSDLLFTEMEADLKDQSINWKFTRSSQNDFLNSQDVNSLIDLSKKYVSYATLWSNLKHDYDTEHLLFYYYKDRAQEIIDILENRSKDD